MLNYSVHAIEELSKLSGLRDSRDALAYQEVLGFLKKAVKFELPENGSLFGEQDRGYDVLTPDLLRLPFPVMALEYHFNFFKGDVAGNFHSPKRVALCLDYEANKSSLIGQIAATYCPKLAEAGGIMLIVLCTVPTNDDTDGWMIFPWSVTFPRFAPDGTNLTVYRYGKKHEKESQIGMILTPLFVSLVRMLLDQYGADQAITVGLRDAEEEMHSLISLLAVLSCSNVKLQNQPAPEQLNKKRVKNGKLPFSEYKTVVVDVRPQVYHEGVTRGPGMTGRQSPREHLRRGHIRHLSSGKNVWVQSAMIGSGTKGKIEKGYVVKI